MSYAAIYTSPIQPRVRFHGNDCIHISITSSDQIVVTTHRHFIQTPRDLLHAALESIFSTMMGSPQGIVLDLNTQIAHGLILDIFHVDNSPRRPCLQMIGRVCNVTVAETSRKPIHYSTKFEALMGSLQYHTSFSPNFEEKLLVSIILPPIKTRVRLVLSLNFDLIDSITLDSLRIDILKFLPSLDAVLLPSGTTVRVALNCSRRDNQGYMENRDVAGEELAGKALLLLPDLLDHTAIKDSAESQGTPHIWMSGYDELLSTILP